MKRARLIRHVKVIDGLGNIVEAKMWQLASPTSDKPHGYKYSLVYISKGERVIGYDNAHRKGDHKHFRNSLEPYAFKTLKQLVRDFYDDIEKFKRGEEI